MITVCIGIGNSDDKLAQFAWAAFYRAVDQAISHACVYVGTKVHGRWASLPHEPWQNACWCIAVDADALPGVLPALRLQLEDLAKKFGQESIAWAQVAETEFIGATEATGR